jgi:hypothetical protein
MPQGDLDARETAVPDRMAWPLATLKPENLRSDDPSKRSPNPYLPGRLA